MNTEETITELLKSIGEDLDRDGLKETPRRYAKFFKEFLNPPEYEMKTFDNADGSNEMVVVRNIPFYSLCEHHLAPFFGTGTIGYIPDKRIIGISKLPRTLDKFSRRLQNQERICQQVVDYIYNELKPKGCGVYLTARHLCMEMRGVQKTGAETITTALKGCFTLQQVKAEFLGYIAK